MSEQWRTGKLGELITIKKGSYITKKEAEPGPYPVILGGQEPAYYIDKYNHTGMAIVISRSGASAGYVSIWNEPIFVTDGFIIEPKDDVCYKFIYYVLKAKQSTLMGLQGGSAIPHVTPRIINDTEVYIPSMRTQRRIADILSAYDDLIENNQKQIKLLEEAAQRLYREWFVELRFPGHETTPVVDGVPEGWEQRVLSDVAAINASNVPHDYALDHIDYVDLSSVHYGLIQNRTRFAVQDAPGRARRKAIHGDIIWGMVRPNLKSYALVLNPKETDVFSTGFAILSAQAVPYSYLYCTVTTDAFVGYLVNCTNGAAYPAVKPEHFAAAKVLIPNRATVEKFDQIARPMLEQVYHLQKQCEVLVEARDRLLPKLMSGEVEE